MKWLTNFLTKTNNRLIENTGNMLLALFWGCVTISLYEILYLQNYQLLWWYFPAMVIAGLTGSGFYHRFLTHKTWECPTWLRNVQMFFITGFAFIPAITWVAVHREHHRYSDVEGKDPHGPQYGWLGNVEVLRYTPNLMYARDLMRDKFYMYQLKYYWPLFIVCASSLIMLFGLSVWAFMVMVLFGIQFSLNMLGHMKSIPQHHLLALFYTPEIYHDKHHKDASNAKLGLMDIPYWTMIKWFPQK